MNKILSSLLFLFSLSLIIITYNSYLNHITRLFYNVPVGCEYFIYEWEDYKKQFNKTFKEGEEDKKFKFYCDNMREAFGFSKLAYKGQSNITEYAVNEYAIWSKEDFFNIKAGMSLIENSDLIIETNNSEIFKIENSFDWRTTNHVSSIKNQNICGSSWAFATIAAIESLYLIENSINSTNLTQEFSINHLLDCSDQKVHCGEKLNWPNSGLTFIKKYGLVSTKDFNQKNITCNETNSLYKIKDFEFSNRNDTLDLERLVSKGPVIVGIDASNMMFYKSGIFSNCGNEINHVVLLVGYTENEWIIKNSWGAKWGENGYIRLAKKVGVNTCGIANLGIRPIGFKEQENVKNITNKQKFECIDQSFCKNYEILKFVLCKTTYIWNRCPSLCGICNSIKNN